MQQIDFYCKKCRKSMKMSYELTGNENVPVLTGVTIRCHTNKCTKVTVLKNYTEGLLTSRADARGRCYI